jgi:hypothetical protein
MREHLRAGIAIYNAGEYHAAHDAWEDHWLALESGTDDERFLHGLIQFTAAVFHARDGNWSGATGLAESAGEYLADLPDEYRSVNLGAVRRALAALARDPEVIERRRPLALTHEGRVLELAALDFGATCVAAAVLAEEKGYDEDLFADAVAYARTDVEREEGSSPFVPLLFDFVREPASRGIVVQRLREHADRRASKDSDVAGLFDP